MPPWTDEWMAWIDEWMDGSIVNWFGWMSFNNRNILVGCIGGSPVKGVFKGLT